METKTYTTLEYWEVDKLASETFGISYEYLAEEELNNDSARVYNVRQKDVDDFIKNGEKEWTEFISGKRQWRAYLLFTALVAIGQIPVGNILVEVSY